MSSVPSKICRLLVLPGAGFILGLVISERFHPLNYIFNDGSEIRRASDGELPSTEVAYRKEGDELGYKATQGDLPSALTLFNRYTYGDRDYQKAFYWAVLAERLGYDTKFGSLIEATENNIKADLYAEANRTDAPREPVGTSNELPAQ